MHKSFVKNFRGGRGGGYNNRSGGNMDYMDMDEYDDDNYPWNAPGPISWNNNSRRPRYGDAYGDYRGGYGPGGGYGPRPIMPGMPPRMPPRMPHRMPPPPLIPPMRPYGPAAPPRPMWGQGFGPRGPPRRNVEDDKAIKYLMRCGVLKEHLKNLPHDLLMLIEPEHCGLCDFTCDSFATSRMHYNSKNHIKNTKKWLSKSQGPKHPNEMPLKARDLYCELCDIQITSKTHGDAHYDGKPHRGIVEGRKKPKNPLLLQSNMEHRLEQLIRREKRCLKPTKDSEGVAVDPDSTMEPRLISPELYCKICKTTVTCTEQMMMHMNGKKHLSKEKQHILNMMRGKIVNNGKEEAGNGEQCNENEGDVEAQAPAEDEGENKANDEGDDDWGNEAWENQDQVQDAE